jgi:hypothetical protein
MVEGAAADHGLLFQGFHQDFQVEILMLGVGVFFQYLEHQLLQIMVAVVEEAAALRAAMAALVL